MSNRKKAREYISKSGYIPNRNEDELTALLDSVKKDQREACHAAVYAIIRKLPYDVTLKQLYAIKDACLNATGDK